MEHELCAIVVSLEARVTAMASPFPGMDPYIEACGLWEDFHATLIGEIKRVLAPMLPKRYVVRTAERSYVRALVDTEYRETFLEIRELNPQHRLVTAIEVLSPSNKRENSPGWMQYLRKRQALLAGHANLVEIDLLRGGRRMPMVDEWPESPYYLLVARRKEAPQCQVWPAHFQHPLPEIPIPLAPPDGDVLLAMQPLIDAVYARSRYDQDIDYRQCLRPAPSAGEAAWLKKHMNGH
jgi:Protein of unknown function (DUF4058)